MAEGISIEVLRKGICKSDIEAINTLVRQLLLVSAENRQHDHSYFTITRLQNTSTIMVVRNDIQIVGLGVFSIKSTLTRSGGIGWVDDLVVDENHRRRGIGEALIKAMIEAGKIWELERLNGTCRPEKTAANNLCLKAGFKLVGLINGTNFYTLEYETAGGN